MRLPVRRTVLRLSLASLATCAAFAFGASAASAASIVVTFSPGTSTSTQRLVVENAGATYQQGIASIQTANATAPDASVDTVIATIKKHASVMGVRKQVTVKALWTPNDPLLSQQWALSMVRATTAWDSFKGLGTTVVAVVDTGVDRNQEDLTGRVLAGKDIVNGDDDPADGHGHGTHVAGIAAASANNGLGIAGVAPNVKILPVKVLTDDGYGSDFGVAAGITWAVDNGAHIINLSLGGSEPSQAMYDAVRYAVDRGVFVACAAGNSSGAMGYPAQYDECFTVSATDNTDALAWFSSFGPGLDIAAPGQDVLSSLPGNTYEAWSGTSMATPMVSGLAALIAARGFNAQQIRTVMNTSSVDLGKTGYDGKFGFGRIDAAAAVKQALPAANIAPVCTAASNVTAMEDVFVSLSVKCADANHPAWKLTYRIATQPANGAAAVVANSADGNIVYTPAANYFGSDAFTVEAVDPAGAVSNRHTVNMSIWAMNDAPVCKDVSIAMSSLGGDILFDCYDLEGDPITYSVTTRPSHGELQFVFSLTADARYTPVRGFFGSDVFSVTASDGKDLGSPYPIPLAPGKDNVATITVAVSYIVTTGTNGADILAGTNAADDMSGLGGDDNINGYGGDDLIHGGAGNDAITVRKGRANVSGGDGSDTINAFSDGEVDVISCGAGRDVVNISATDLMKDTIDASCERIVKSLP